MSQEHVPNGLEAIEDVAPPSLPIRPRTLGAGLRLNIRGRSVRLRGLHRSPTGLVRWLVILGPGLVAASAGNDAGGIATYSAAGAKYGYQMIWVMVVITVALAVVQETCARLGAATGRGLLDLIRERFGIGWGLFAVAAILIANSALVVTEFVGIGAAMELLGLSKFVGVPLAAGILWYGVIYTSYTWVERICLLLTLVFLAYPFAAIMARPHWAGVLKGALVPTLQRDSDYLFLLVGLMGTTITPYMQLFQQSSLVEKGVARRHYSPERIDAYVGAVFSNLMSIFMIIATASTLHVVGKTDIETAADAAKALEPIVGSFARTLFAVGLLGASFLAAAVLPLATSYAVSEVVGAPKGVNLDFRRAPTFFGLFTLLIVMGAGLSLIPGAPVIRLLVGTQVLNGIVLPFILIFVLLLINDRRVAGTLRNTRFYNVLGWGTFVLVSTAVLVMLGVQGLEAIGIHLMRH